MTWLPRQGGDVGGVRCSQVAPSKAQVSAIGLAPGKPPNSTTSCRASSQTIAVPSRADGTAWVRVQSPWAWAVGGAARVRATATTIWTARA